MRTIGISLIATLLATAPVSAQVRADPGVVIGNRIAVRVNVTLADEETPYSPARDLALAFSRAGADTVIARTDEAGVITVLLPKGDYVVSTRQPYQWKGRWFTWRVPISVRADMPAVELNRANARADQHGAPVEKSAPGGQVQGTAETSPSPPLPTDVRSNNGALPWLSIEAGGEGGPTRLDSGDGSDAGFGGAAAFVGGLGPVALALGYRYTSVRYGKDIDNGSTGDESSSGLFATMNLGLTFDIFSPAR